MLMSNADWSKAPKDAQFYSFGVFRKHDHVDEYCWNGLEWVSSVFDDISWHEKQSDFEYRPDATPEPASDEVSKTLNERQSVYGDFADVADATQKMEDILIEMPSYNKSSSDKREAAHMILQKLARAFSGDPDYEDNWHDIQGYAKLVEDNLK